MIIYIILITTTTTITIIIIIIFLLLLLLIIVVVISPPHQHPHGRLSCQSRFRKRPGWSDASFQGGASYCGEVAPVEVHTQSCSLCLQLDF